MNITFREKDDCLEIPQLRTLQFQLVHSPHKLMNLAHSLRNLLHIQACLSVLLASGYPGLLVGHHKAQERGDGHLVGYLRQTKDE